jgi:hypothetical protein
MKEFIYYEEYWEGKNWLGIPIRNPLAGHIEGKYTEVITKPVLDERTGEHIDNAYADTREVYYIPFSKKNVDEIIANSALTERSAIRYIVKFSNQDGQEVLNPSSRNQFSYDMFLWPWDKLYEWQHWPQEELFTSPKAFKSGTKLEFKPQ